jgi:type III pantothenate kinase
MTVLLDAGNSRFKWARLREGSLSDVSSEHYSSYDRAQGVVAALAAIDAPQRLLVASVLGDDFREELKRLAASRLGVEPEFVVPVESAYGIRVAYANPSELGADRFAALVAARWQFQQPSIVVDCGTALTIDALTADGEHLGGLILPGLALLRRSLTEHTALINVGLEDNDAHLFGRSTSHGVRSGTLRALIAAIDRIVADMTNYMIEHCDRAAVNHLMTGGAGAHLLPHLAIDYVLEPWLVLQGLAIIAEG